MVNSLRQYNIADRLKLYGDESMKPNQHWANHLPDQLRDFGPVYAFWAFLGERFNKHLKNFNWSTHKGGQLEISMLRMHARETALKTLVSLK